MGAVIAKIVFKKGNDVIHTDYKSLNEIKVTGLEGEEYENLGQVVEGKKVYLIVNVAS